MDDVQTPLRKRPRPVVSCSRCREKKLRCDRVTPCENCIKAGFQSKCVYGQHPTTTTPEYPEPIAPKPILPHPVDTGAAHGNRPTQSVGVVEDLQTRVAKLEDALAITRQWNASALKENKASPQSVNTTHSIYSPKHLGTLVVKGSRTRYHGQNDRVTLLNQFTEAKDFINRFVEDPSILRLAKEVQMLQAKTQQQFKQGLPKQEELSPGLMKLREFLPPQSICDRLLHVYLTNFEKTLRILHVPTFLRQYQEFWASRLNDLCSTSAFLPQLTSILAISLALEERKLELEDPSAFTYMKQASLDVVQGWLDELGRKQRSELSTFQTETLLFLAKQMRLSHVEKLWMATGALVRSAMTIGLHLDPTKSDKISFYQAENRRRLWITIVELDIQASIASGMPLIAPECDFGPLTPSNIHDTDYDEKTEEPPPSRPLDEWTDSLAQIVLATSMAQRIKVISLMQSPSAEADLNELVTEGTRLEEMLSIIPPPLRLANSSSSAHSTPGILLNRVLLDVFMRRPLLSIYRPLLLNETHSDPALEHVRRSCLDSSLAILSYQDYFDPHVADLDVFASTSLHWNMFQVFCKNDIRWAALSVCQYIKVAMPPNVPTPTPPALPVIAPVYPVPGTMNMPNGSTPASGTLTPTSRATAGTSAPSKASLTRLVEQTIDGLIRSVAEPGSSLKDILFLAIVLPSVRGARGSAQFKENLMYEGSRKALGDCRQVLLQVLAENGNGEVANGAREQAQEQVQGQAQGQVQVEGEIQMGAAQGMPNALAPMNGMQGTMLPPDDLQQARAEFFGAWPGVLGADFENFQGDIFGMDGGAFGFGQ